MNTVAMISFGWPAGFPADVGGTQFLMYFLALGALCCLTLTRYYNGLHVIPGPLLASISSIWKVWAVWCEDMPRRNTLLHEEYGPIVRIGPNHVSASSAEALQAIHRAKNSFVKSPTYSILQPRFDGQDLHNIFSMQDPSSHAALKRTIGSLYSVTAIAGLEHHIDNSIALFLSRLGDLAQPQSKPVDMSAWLQYYAFDCLGSINFSQTLGFLETGMDVDGICKLDHEMMMYYAVMGQVPGLERFWSRLKSWTMKRKPNPLFTFTLNAVKQRQKNPNNSEDMLNSFLDLHKREPDKFSIRGVIAATYINVVTAHDVLAITLRAVLYYLCRYPGARQRLCEELSEAGSSGKLSSPAQGTEAARLEYLSAVINETLRIHPSTGLILERYVPKGGITIHGKHIPEHTIIGVNCWVINRNKDIFGDDVETFRPERWIEGEPDSIQKMRRSLFTFGAGSRSCIGKNLAMMQITKVVAELYRNFDFQLADPSEEWKVSGGWLTRQTQMDMIVSKREQ